MTRGQIKREHRRRDRIEKLTGWLAAAGITLLVYALVVLMAVL